MAAVAFIWVQVAVGAISATIFLTDRSTDNGDSLATLLVGQAVSVGLPAVLSCWLLTGQRWAWAAILVLAAAGLVLRAVGLADDPFIPIGLFQTVSIVCNVAIIASLLTSSARAQVRHRTAGTKDVSE